MPLAFKLPRPFSSFHHLLYIGEALEAPWKPLAHEKHASLYWLSWLFFRKKVPQTLQFSIWLGYKHENSALLSQLLPSVQHYYFLFLTRPLRPVLWSCTLFESDSKCRIWIFNFGIFHKFCPIKNDLSGNTVWPRASGFQKLAKINHFWHFW